MKNRLRAVITVTYESDEEPEVDKAEWENGILAAEDIVTWAETAEDIWITFERAP